MNPLRYWKTLFFGILITSLVVYFIQFARFDITQYSPFSGSFDTTKPLVSTFFVTMFSGIFGISTVLFINFILGQYSTSSKTYHEVLHKISKLGLLINGIGNPSPALGMYLRDLPKNLFDAITSRNLLFLEVFSDDHELSRIKPSLLELEMKGLNLIVEFMNASEPQSSDQKSQSTVQFIDPQKTWHISRKDPEIRKTFASIMDNMVILEAVHKTQIPTPIYRLVVVGSLVVHSLSLPFYWAMYAWVLGSIAIALVVGALLFLMDILKHIGSIFHVNGYNHQHFVHLTGQCAIKMTNLFPIRDLQEKQEIREKTTSERIVTNFSPVYTQQTSQSQQYQQPVQFQPPIQFQPQQRSNYQQQSFNTNLNPQESMNSQSFYESVFKVPNKTK